MNKTKLKPIVSAQVIDSAYNACYKHLKGLTYNDVICVTALLHSDAINGVMLDILDERLTTITKMRTPQ